MPLFCAACILKIEQAMGHRVPSAKKPIALGLKWHAYAVIDDALGHAATRVDHRSSINRSGDS